MECGSGSVVKWKKKKTLFAGLKRLFESEIFFKCSMQLLLSHNTS